MDKLEKLCFSLIALLVLGLLSVVIAFTLTNVSSVEVTVDEATLERLALVAPGNGTAYVAYNLSLAVAVRNPNFAMRVWRTAPLDAELRLAGNHPFALLRLAGADGTTDHIRPGRSKVYRVAAAAAESAPVALGSDAAAAFDRESAVGMFRLELVVSGEFKYEGNGGSSITTVRCPLTVPLSMAPAAVAFARFERTMPQPCTDISDN